MTLFQERNAILFINVQKVCAKYAIFFKQIRFDVRQQPTIKLTATIGV